MAEIRQAQKYYGPALYLLCSAIIIIFSIAPLGSFVAAWFPQTLFALTFAIMLRKSNVVPLWAIAVVFFARDIFYFQPLGLEAFLIVLSMSFIRNARRGIGETYFREWGSFALLLVLIFVLKTIFGILLGIGLPDVTLQFRSIIATLIIYPLVTAALSLQFGMIKPLAV